MCYALEGKEGERMRVKKSNMNILIMRVYSKTGINLNVVKHPRNQCGVLYRYIQFNLIDLIYQIFSENVWIIDKQHVSLQC